MPRNKRPTITYYYRGQIERWNASKRSYTWTAGYSPGNEMLVTYPWNTYRECQKEAAAQGCRAVFVKDRRIAP